MVKKLSSAEECRIDGRTRIIDEFYVDVFPGLGAIQDEDAFSLSALKVQDVHFAEFNLFSGYPQARTIQRGYRYGRLSGCGRFECEF